MRYGYTYLGFTEPFICKLVAGLVAQMGDQFPELRAQQTLIERVIEEEESSFLRTLATGITLLDGVIAEVKKQGGTKISGHDAFVLYDTYGFPIDLTELIAREQDVEVDLSAFETELQAQKERSRNAAAVATDDWQELFPLAQSEFVGYDTLTAPVRIARYRRVSAKNRTTYQLVFDRTPFYGNSGGQIGDVGFIENADEKIDVVATDKENGLIIHIVDKLPENPAADFTAVVDPAKRQAAANNHTATHLLDAALRKVLGTHVEQKGSFVTPDYLRFDFSHFRKVTLAELREVERLVNREIRANHPLVERRDATLAEAQAEGAIMLFGEKYGDRVRMVRFGDSVELCGGTHTCATGTIGFFQDRERERRFGRRAAHRGRDGRRRREGALCCGGYVAERRRIPEQHAGRAGDQEDRREQRRPFEGGRGDASGTGPRVGRPSRKESSRAERRDSHGQAVRADAGFHQGSGL